MRLWTKWFEGKNLKQAMFDLQILKVEEIISLLSSLMKILKISVTYHPWSTEEQLQDDHIPIAK